jgi:hypothetical protein
MEKLEITNPKVVEFYKQRPSLNFETINLMVIEMLDNCITTKSLDNALANQIVEKFDCLKDSLSKMRDDYTEDLKKILHISTISGNENVATLIKEHTNTVQDKCMIRLPTLPVPK